MEAFENWVQSEVEGLSGFRRPAPCASPRKRVLTFPQTRVVRLSTPNRQAANAVAARVWSEAPTNVLPFKKKPAIQSSVLGFDPASPS